MPIINKVGSINSLIWHIIHIYEPEMQEKSIDFAYRVPNKNIYGSFDGDKIQKITSNLLSNSLKYTKPNSNGKIKLDVDIEESQLIISVKDNGIGIDKKYHEEIFSKFYRVSDTNDAKSSGIGLSFVKELVDLLNGTIELDSKVNIGSKFIVKIPFEEIQDYKTKISEEAESKKTEKSAQTIMIVEDNPEIQKLVKEIFVDKYKIVSADNGKSALQKIEKRVPDLIISDLMMPIVNGIELTKKIKNDNNLNHIPIIILSAKTQREDKIKAIESGADVYISKPFDVQVYSNTR